MQDLEKFLQNTPAGEHWQKITPKHHHGINLSLLSVHSEQSEGCGDFYDLLSLIDFCKSIGFSTIQLLPLYDSGLDPSPYNGISAFALNPVYLRLSSLPNIRSSAKLQQQIQELSEYNKASRVAYQKVREQKIAIFKEYIQSQQPEASALYQQFLKENSWVIKYAQFAALKQHFQGDSWEKWPADERMIDQALRELSQEIETYSLLQYFCYKQLKEVKQHADRHGILLMGDVPILLSRDSSDVWANPELFLLDRSCGAPPDMYNPDGQNWGFPIYNWEAHEKTGFAWWTQKLQFAENFFHLYRLDHVVGFFRFWSYSVETPDLPACFLPREKAEWLPLGSKLLQILLEKTSMLPIGEDLGKIPKGVRETLQQLGIPGTRVCRWEYTNKEFIDPASYPPLTLTTLSTHDSETLRTWWERIAIDSRKWAYQFHIPYSRFLSPETIDHLLLQSHRSSSLFHINLLQEYFSLFPELIHSLASEERINTPGTMSEKNWTYRMKPSIETFCTHNDLKKAMQRYSQAPCASP